MDQKRLQDSPEPFSLFFFFFFGQSAAVTPVRNRNVYFIAVTAADGPRVGKKQPRAARKPTKAVVTAMKSAFHSPVTKSSDL